MPDIFVEWPDDQTIIVYDADHTELWRGDWHAIALLRALADNGLIGLYEDDQPDRPAPFTLIAVEDLRAARLCDAAAARLRSGRQASASVETVARCAIDMEREER